MQIHCFRLQEKGLLQLTEERPTASWLADGIVRLFDVDYPDVTKELREVLAPLNLDGALLDQIESQDGGVCVEHFPHALFFRIPRPAMHDFKDPYISVICVGETLIVLHKGIYLPVEQILARITRFGGFGISTITDLLLHILLLGINRDIELYQSTRQMITELSNGFDQRLTANVLDEIQRLTNQVSRLQSTTEDRLILMGTLLTMKSPLLELNEVRPYFKEAMKELKQMQRWLERLEVRLQVLSQYCNLSLQNSTNNRLQVLTVISAIFMPLTLIAGIYGMNFINMPELQTSYGYFIILGLMVLLGGGLGIFFYVRGWFE
ncbi:CorA family divalent cation transporter [uncultured Nitrospira sp.]|uniref:magnesium transporter CorA family protein n=1 Tax=uncultured Nitrospira sp. TaxID=157176 RepID=UPI00314013C8